MHNQEHHISPDLKLEAKMVGTRLFEIGLLIRASNTPEQILESARKYNQTTLDFINLINKVKQHELDNTQDNQ